tara:strand:+ start:54 stop:248 length:195 start_codon:yes stop_codon:yes gene_type:complete
MLLAKKIIMTNMLISGAVLAAVGSAAFAYALTSPDCRKNFKDSIDKMRDCKNKMCNRPSDINGT